MIHACTAHNVMHTVHIALRIEIVQFRYGFLFSLEKLDFFLNFSDKSSRFVSLHFCGAPSTRLQVQN